jgi:AcrR family transcriptional regulator
MWWTDQFDENSVRIAHRRHLERHLRARGLDPRDRLGSQILQPPQHGVDIDSQKRNQQEAVRGHPGRSDRWRVAFEFQQFQHARFWICRVAEVDRAGSGRADTENGGPVPFEYRDVGEDTQADAIAVEAQAAVDVRGDDPCVMYALHIQDSASRNERASAGTVVAVSSSVEQARKKSAKALATRRRLIDAAARMFADRGYENTSVRDLGNELGMTSGAIYTHFRNKADLLAAAVASTIADQVDQPETPAGSSYVDGAASIFTHYERQTMLRTLLLGGAAAARGDDAVRDRLRDIQVDRMAEWMEVARRDQTAGKVAPDVDVDTLVKLLWALEFGLVIFDVCGIEPPDIEQTVALVTRLVGG